MKLETLSEQRCFGGLQGIYRHQSDETGTPMQFSVYAPPAAEKVPVPVVWYLSGLTCTEENFTVKAGAQRFAARHDVMLVAPDTSPRGAGIKGEDESYDFGSGAGFYVDATEAPWDQNYRMYSYVTRELPELIFSEFSADKSCQGITGHSMGGHGALTIGLKNPDTYQSISAFSPICAPTECDWGKKAFAGYLGSNQQQWSKHDATCLIASGSRSGEILIDQGESDDFLENQLMPGRFKQVCAEAGQDVNIRMQAGYDHSYYFIASFIEDHIGFHAKRLYA